MMSRIWHFLLLAVLLTACCSADVSELLRWQRLGDSGAYVSSGFHDWRSVSKYRRVPGLHAGYDIAMLPGAEVRTPWAGTVVAITPWYGRELGVTVRLRNGWEATFGHIETSLRLGQRLGKGDLVGWVVVDHVDVKMRTADGRPIDFDIAGPPSEHVAVAEPPPVETELYPEEYERYNKLLSVVTKLDKQVQMGLAPAAKLATNRQELESVKPLARIHAQRSSLRFQEKLPISVAPDRPSREVTDFILQIK